MSDKARPIQERIAELFGRSAYFDPRDGAGGTCPVRIRHSDVAAALGYVGREHGRVAALVLETHYGSTLAHERELSRAWEDYDKPDRRDKSAITMTRFAGALAIRRMSGVKYTTGHYSDYAYLLFSRREELQRKVDMAYSWLMGLHDTALGTFRKNLRHAVASESLDKSSKAA